MLPSHTLTIDFSTITHFFPPAVSVLLGLSHPFSHAPSHAADRLFVSTGLFYRTFLPDAVGHIGRSLYFYGHRRGKVGIAAVRSSFPLTVLRLFVAATLALRLPLQFLKQTRLIITRPSQDFGLVPYSSPPLAMQVACRSS